MSDSRSIWRPLHCGNVKVTCQEGASRKEIQSQDNKINDMGNVH